MWDDSPQWLLDAVVDRCNHRGVLRYAQQIKYSLVHSTPQYWVTGTSARCHCGPFSTGSGYQCSQLGTDEDYMQALGALLEVPTSRYYCTSAGSSFSVCARRSVRHGHSCCQVAERVGLRFVPIGRDGITPHHAASWCCVACVIKDVPKKPLRSYRA